MVRNESQSESDEKSESQYESEDETPAEKTEFTEGIFWRLTVSMPNTTIKIKLGRKKPSRK